jgi:5-bromo-4-chloroindolyl phosphate hydrolysis protein
MESRMCQLELSVQSVRKELAEHKLLHENFLKYLHDYLLETRERIERLEHSSVKDQPIKPALAHHSTG